VGQDRLEATVTSSQVDDHEGDGCREHLWVQIGTPDGEIEEDLFDAGGCTVPIP
jgi:hypothetical protein